MTLFCFWCLDYVLGWTSPFANASFFTFTLQKPEFVNYLKYLLYWKKPEYVKFLRYPQCIYMLELLQYKQFRAEIVNTPCAKFIEDQMLLHWQYYTRKRVRMQQAMMESIRQRHELSNTAVSGSSSVQTANLPVKTEH